MSGSTSQEARFVMRDLAEIVVGACVMAFPVATTGEVWDLGKELSLLRVMLFALASLFFLGLLIYFLHRPEAGGSRKIFLQRVLSTYLVTLLISALLLWGVDRFDLVGEFWISIKRTVLVAFPASFAATVVDSLGSG